jgi:hypothetical protein
MGVGVLRRVLKVVRGWWGWGLVRRALRRALRRVWRSCSNWVGGTGKVAGWDGELGVVVVIGVA